MFCGTIAGDDRGGHGIRHIFPLEKIVDVAVGELEVGLVGLAGILVEQVGGGELEVEALGGSEVLEQRPTLALAQAGERQHVGSAIAELGKESGDGFRRVVGADDEQAVLAGDRVLGDHAGARLDVALVEVGDALAGGLTEFCGDAVDTALDVEGDRATWLDEAEGGLGVVFVCLDGVGEPNGDELDRFSIGRETLCCELAEASGEGGVLAAADAEYEAVGSGGANVVAEEGDAALDLFRCVDDGADVEGRDDF